MMAANVHLVESNGGADRRRLEGGDTTSCYPNESLFTAFTTGFIICRASILFIYAVPMWFYEKARVQFAFTTRIQFFSLVTVVINLLINLSHGYSADEDIDVSYDDVFWVPAIIEFVAHIFQRNLNSFLFKAGTALSYYPANLYEVQEKLAQFVSVGDMT